MLKIFKNKSEDLPKFWQDYEAKFQEKHPTEIAETRFVVFDTETTTLNKDDNFSKPLIYDIGFAVCFPSQFSTYTNTDIIVFLTPCLIYFQA